MPPPARLWCSDLHGRQQVLQHTCFVSSVVRPNRMHTHFLADVCMHDCHDRYCTAGVAGAPIPAELQLLPVDKLPQSHVPSHLHASR